MEMDEKMDEKVDEKVDEKSNDFPEKQFSMVSKAQKRTDLIQPPDISIVFSNLVSIKCRLLPLTRFKKEICRCS